jgi:phage virion morphogenesis protein
MQIEIEIQGLDKAKEIFKELEKFTSPEEQKKVMDTIGEFTEVKIKESFANKKSPFGQNWEPLKKSTLKAKKGKGDILRFSGDLQDKWTIEATSSRVEVYGNTTAKSYPYGAVHQYGTSKAGRNRNVKIVARSFLPIDETGNIEPKLKDEIEDLLIEELRKRIE